MCNFENGFVLCLCNDPKTIVHNKNSRRFKQKDKMVEYIWRLDRFLKKNTSGLIGMYEMPANDIGEGLTNEWVLLHLNDGECFDFEYTPHEGDSISFKNTASNYTYLSFLYKGGQWIADQHDPFDIISEKLLNGSVKPIDN